MSATQAAKRLKSELKRYLAPSLLCLDELGFLPIDKHGADLLFQVISLRYEQGPMVITSNRAYKDGRVSSTTIQLLPRPNLTGFFNTQKRFSLRAKVIGRRVR
ncbi:hypothetical protein SBDP1_350008 [Syntrophobacter sp. SbD1]|nr:hypothetical protein SBDP1_350008 [Syntrophobacter sp. SbD1]